MKHRRRTRLWTLCAALALCVVVLPTAMASSTVGTMQITVDTTLAEDHSGPVEVVADNVTLDCAGFKVIWAGGDPAPNAGVGVIGRTGVTVRNCDVSGFRKGIYLEGSSGSTVTDNVVTSNTEFGIILFDAANSNDVSRNVARDNGRTGFEVGTSGNNTFHENRSIGNDYTGFTVSGVALSNTFASNTASENGVDGFFVVNEGAMSNVFMDNETHGNGFLGMDDGTSGKSGDLGTDNTYTGNHCTGNVRGSIPSGLCQEEKVGLVDPTTGMWRLRHSENDFTSFYYGNPGDVPFIGDWDCDTVATPGLFRTSDAFAYLRNSNSQGIADIRFFFGNPSDIPLAGDFNGDGCDTLSIYRPSEARFYIINKLGENEGGLGAAEYSFLFGNPGDKPVVGDWDGDGIDEIGLHRETTGSFYYRNTLTTGIADGQFYFGDPGDRFVSGDWGVVDGVDTPGVFRPSSDTYYFRHTLTQGNADSQFVWTGAGMNWLPVSGDFALD